MPFDIVIGRSAADKEKYGTKGTVFMGKQYVKMGQTTSLSNPVYLDIVRSHVMLVCGKRGSGKSYSLGVITEGMANLPEIIKQNLTFVLFDTMGVFWTMKHPNLQDPDLLEKWGLEAKGLEIVIFTPVGFYEKFKEEGIPADVPFSLRPADLSPEDWFLTFDIIPTSSLGVFIERIILELQEQKEKYSIEEILQRIIEDTKAEQITKDAAENLFRAAARWGVFSVSGTPLEDLTKPGQIAVVDLSAYATQPGAWRIKFLVTGLISQSIFIQRMVARKKEEYATIRAAVHYLTEEIEKKKPMPLVWLVIDEAHEFLPKKGKTAATDPLITILREGRQPGVSLLLATQQPGKIHTDVMTQSDIILSHRLTAKIDIEALGALMQSYLRSGLDAELNRLPKTKGAAIILDDNNERLFPMKVRPRFTWHGGSAPSAMPEED